MFKINNRRYTGSKYRLKDWISHTILKNCRGNSLVDLFAGTGIIASSFINHFKSIVINDLLFSNETIYKAFFLSESYNTYLLNDIKKEFQAYKVTSLKSNYISNNFGNKFFNLNDAKIIGFIREKIEIYKSNLNSKEYNILLASLLYSLDKCANTVGHYDAYIKNKDIPQKFYFDLISPFPIKDKSVKIHREDANILIRKINADIFYIDPPYNSRQYSRFYHVLENITKWEKPTLSGVALKPVPENMSLYCRSNAKEVFEDLINNIKAKFIVVSYNNTYDSKSSSSKNKISLKDINKILTSRGKVKVFDQKHTFFNAGKTNFSDHKELLFVMEVTN